MYCSEVNLTASVNQLVLSDNGLSGTLPSALGAFSSLYNLGMHSNKLHGPIPSEIGSLGNLKYVWLKSNRLTGTVPTELIDVLSNNTTDGVAKSSLRVESNMLTGTIGDCGSIVTTADCGGAVPEVICDCCYMCYTSAPTPGPSSIPTAIHSSFPTAYPSVTPSSKPSSVPTYSPSDLPSVQLSNYPSSKTSSVPTEIPSDSPSNHPSNIPTESPSNEPSDFPSMSPSKFPSFLPSHIPSDRPSVSSSSIPSHLPTSFPSFEPSFRSSTNPAHVPSLIPSNSPSLSPSITLSSTPTFMPSELPLKSPSIEPSDIATDKPSIEPTPLPSNLSSQIPSHSPSISTTQPPSYRPSVTPSQDPTYSPSTTSSLSPSISPTQPLSYRPSVTPSQAPTYSPSTTSSLSPSTRPTSSPSTVSSSIPSFVPSTIEPNVMPVRAHSQSPSIGVTASVGVGSLPTHTPSITPSISSESFIFAYEFNSDLKNLHSIDLKLQDYFDSKENQENCNIGGGCTTFTLRRLELDNYFPVDVSNVNTIIDESRTCIPPTSNSTCSHVNTTIEVHYDNKEFDGKYVRLLVLDNFLRFFMENIPIDVTLTGGETMSDEMAELNVGLAGVDRRYMNETEQIVFSESILEFLRGQWATKDPPVIMANVTFLSQTLFNEDEESNRYLNETIATDAPAIDVTVIVEGFYLPPPEVVFDDLIVETFTENKDKFTEILNDHPFFENADVTGVSATSIDDDPNSVEMPAFVVTETKTTFGPLGKTGTMTLAIAGWTILWSTMCYMIWIKYGNSTGVKKKWKQKSLPAVDPVTIAHDSDSYVNGNGQAYDDEKGCAVGNEKSYVHIDKDELSSLNSMISYSGAVDDPDSKNNLKDVKKDVMNTIEDGQAFSKVLRNSNIGAPDISDTFAYGIGPM